MMTESEKEAKDATVIVKFSGMHAPPDAPMPTVTHTAQTRLDHQSFYSQDRIILRMTMFFFVCVYKMKKQSLILVFFFFFNREHFLK